MTIDYHIGAGGSDLTGNRDLHHLQHCTPDMTPCVLKQTVFSWEMMVFLDTPLGCVSALQFGVTVADMSPVATTSADVAGTSFDVQNMSKDDSEFMHGPYHLIQPKQKGRDVGIS